MSRAILISILVVNLRLVFGNYMEVESLKSRVDRNNIVNKGIWVRNRENDFEKAAKGAFIFRGNAIDVDNVLQGDFNAFEDNSQPLNTFITSYVERNKRSPDPKNVHRHRRSRKSLTNCIGNDCQDKNNDNTVDDQSSLIKSKLITKLKPASVFNDYPYEIAILLANNKIVNQAKNYSAYTVNYLVGDKENNTVVPLSITDGPKTLNIGSITQKDSKAFTVDTNKASTPKRSMENHENYINNANLIGDSNNTEHMDHNLVSNKVDRDVFDFKDSDWRSNNLKTPIPILSEFKVISKDQDESKLSEKRKSKAITERGLAKIIGMLTRTFKKILQHHEDIKNIQMNLQRLNSEFGDTVETMEKKLSEIDKKYLLIVQMHEHIKTIEANLLSKDQQYKNKEQELAKNLMDFKRQQKEFIEQQRQFYNIQKLMLLQNERINSKQNAIAKTQSEISHRQNNFARILKKAKQMYTDVRHNPKIKPMNYSVVSKNHQNRTEMNKVTEVFTPSPTQVSTTSTESVKINLFSLQSIAPAKVKNQDSLLLKDKDKQPVDELVYKYYFNNTYFDNLIKSFVSTVLALENTDDSRKFKNKRQQLIKLPVETTILLPVNKTEDNSLGLEGKPLNRERRWIKNHARRHRKNHSKLHFPNSNTEDTKTMNTPIDKNTPNEGEEMKLDAKNENPFTSMATNFCNAIGQNGTPQVLGWCVEKALRKLKNIDIKTPPLAQPKVLIESNTVKPIRQFSFVSSIPTEKQSDGTPTPDATDIVQTTDDTKITNSPGTSETGSSSYVTTLPTEYVALITLPAQTTQDDYNFFPDNDQLESNLKQFDIKPDTEGNVYYDGSLHASDLRKDEKNIDDEEDDIMPGLDSNSKIDNIDPDTFDPQGMRRALIRRMKYEALLKKMTKLRV